MTVETPRGRRQCAFTLIELLVVIAIIALLMAILLPSLNRAKESARTVVCASNLRQLGTTFHLYAADNQGSIPRYEYGAGTYRILLSDQWYRFYYPLLIPERICQRDSNGDPIEASYDAPYLVAKELKIFDCPTTKKEVYYAWVAGGTHPKNCDYGIADDMRGHVNLNKKDRPSHRLGDYAPDRELLLEAYELNPWYSQIIGPDRIVCLRVDFYVGFNRGVGTHHQGKTNVLHIDGSVDDRDWQAYLNE